MKYLQIPLIFATGMLLGWAIRGGGDPPDRAEVTDEQTQTWGVTREQISEIFGK